MCFMTCFFIWLPEKKDASLCRYPENNLFTLRKKLIPIENLKRPFVKSAFFFCPYICISVVFHRVIFVCRRGFSLRVFRNFPYLWGILI